MGAFGVDFASWMTVADYRDGAWTPLEVRAAEDMPLHPATHALHYASSCFEGLKAYRRSDGGVHVFRLDRHVARMQASARALYLPVPTADLIEQAIRRAVDACRSEIPELPGTLYLRPVLIGTEANIGGAASPSSQARLYVLASPVGDYFSGGLKPLRVYVDEIHARATAGFGQVKTGGNYAAALGPLLAARKAHHADQVLFCPGGDVQETGAANFLLITGSQLRTKPLDGSVLAGVTRDSILTLAGEMGLEVVESDFTVAELLADAPGSEAALSGTAAVLTPVGTLIHNGSEHPVGDGGYGATTRRLRERLVAIQGGAGPDPWGWRFEI